MPVETEIASPTPSEPARPQKRKRTSTQADFSEAKPEAEAMIKIQLLEAEVKEKESQLAEMISTIGKALAMSQLHYTWAFDVLDGKNIPQMGRDAAKMALEGDGDVLNTMIREFEAKYGKRGE